MGNIYSDVCILLKEYTSREEGSSTSPHRDATILSEEGSGERGGSTRKWSTEGFSGIGMEEILIWKLKSNNSLSWRTCWSKEISEVSVKVSSLYFS